MDPNYNNHTDDSQNSELNDPPEVQLEKISQTILNALLGLSPAEAIEVLANAMNIYSYIHILTDINIRTRSLPPKLKSIEEFMSFYKNDVLMNGETITNSIGRQAMMMYMWLISINKDKK